MSADARHKPAALADAPAVAELLAELGLQLGQGLG
jgi:hypothetical protein